MFSRHYDYGVYVFCIMILALLAIIPFYRVIIFLLKKEKQYLRFTEYFVAIGLFLSNLLGLSHLRSYLLSWEYESTVHNLKGITANSIELGVKHNSHLMYIEFFASVFFFVMLIFVLILKNRSSKLSPSSEPEKGRL